VLAGPRLGDDARLAHPLGEQPLADRVVDLVRTRMSEIFALQEDPCTADPLGQAGRVVEGRRSSDELAEQPLELGLESWIPASVLIGLDQLLDRR